MSENINDFGFTEQDGPISKIDDRLQRMENLIMPLLQKLIETSDSPTLTWPNRKEKLEQLVKEIKEITRS